MKGLIFTYLLTYGGAVVSLFNPFYGLLIYVAFAILKPEALWFWSVPAGNYSRIVALAMLAGWAMHGFGKWNLGRAKPVVYSLIGFLGWAAVSAAFAPNQAVAWRFVENMAKIVLPFLVGISVIDTSAKMRQLAWVITISQGYVALELNRAYYEGFNRIQEIGFGGMDNNCAAIAMVTCVGFAFFLALSADRWWKKAIAVAAALLMAHCVMFAFSRGGMLALCITGAVAFVLVPKRPVHYAIFALAVAACVRLAGDEVLERFFTSFADAEERDASAQSRVIMWGKCIDMMFDSPIIGCGPDHFKRMSSQIGLTANKEAHTLWLQVGAELGVVGLGFLVFFYLSSIAGLWRLIRRARYVADPLLVDAARMVIASLVGFMVAAQFVSLEGLEQPYYINLVGACALKLASAAPVEAPAWRPVTSRYASQLAHA